MWIERVRKLSIQTDIAQESPFQACSRCDVRSGEAIHGRGWTLWRSVGDGAMRGRRRTAWRCSGAVRERWGGGGQRAWPHPQIESSRRRSPDPPPPPAPARCRNVRASGRVPSLNAPAARGFEGDTWGAKAGHHGARQTSNHGTRLLEVMIIMMIMMMIALIVSMIIINIRLITIIIIMIINWYGNDCNHRWCW